MSLSLGDDEDVVALLGSAAGERADDVVGFEALSLEDRNVEGFEGAADVGNLASQVLGHGLALRLVTFIADLFEALRLRVPLA